MKEEIKQNNEDIERTLEEKRKKEKYWKMKRNKFLKMGEGGTEAKKSKEKREGKRE